MAASRRGVSHLHDAKPATISNGGALPGIINGHPTVPTSATQWVGQFSGQSASCLRFQVISASQSHDLAMSVVAPDGVVFNNNNGGVAPCTACPKVVIAAAKNGAHRTSVALTTCRVASAANRPHGGVGHAAETESERVLAEGRSLRHEQRPELRLAYTGEIVPESARL